MRTCLLLGVVFLCLAVVTGYRVKRCGGHRNLAELGQQPTQYPINRFIDENGDSFQNANNRVYTQEVSSLQGRRYLPPDLDKESNVQDPNRNVNAPNGDNDFYGAAKTIAKGLGRNQYSGVDEEVRPQHHIELKHQETNRNFLREDISGSSLQNTIEGYKQLTESHVTGNRRIPINRNTNKENHPQNPHLVPYFEGDIVNNNFSNKRKSQTSSKNIYSENGLSGPTQQPTIGLYGSEPKERTKDLPSLGLTVGLGLGLGLGASMGEISSSGFSQSNAANEAGISSSAHDVHGRVIQKDTPSHYVSPTKYGDGISQQESGSERPYRKEESHLYENTAFGVGHKKLNGLRFGTTVSEGVSNSKYGGAASSGFDNVSLQKSEAIGLGGEFSVESVGLKAGAATSLGHVGIQKSVEPGVGGVVSEAGSTSSSFGADKVGLQKSVGLGIERKVTEGNSNPKDGASRSSGFGHISLQKSVGFGLGRAVPVGNGGLNAGAATSSSAGHIGLQNSVGVDLRAPVAETGSSLSDIASSSFVDSHVGFQKSEFGQGKKDTEGVSNSNGGLIISPGISHISLQKSVGLGLGGTVPVEGDGLKAAIATPLGVGHVGLEKSVELGLGSTVAGTGSNLDASTTSSIGIGHVGLQKSVGLGLGRTVLEGVKKLNDAPIYSGIGHVSLQQSVGIPHGFYQPDKGDDRVLGINGGRSADSGTYQTYNGANGGYLYRYHPIAAQPREGSGSFGSNIEVNSNFGLIPLALGNSVRIIAPPISASNELLGIGRPKLNDGPATSSGVGHVTLQKSVGIPHGFYQPGKIDEAILVINGGRPTNYGSYRTYTDPNNGNSYRYHPLPSQRREDSGSNIEVNSNLGLQSALGLGLGNSVRINAPSVSASNRLLSIENSRVSPESENVQPYGLNIGLKNDAGLGGLGIGNSLGIILL